MISFHYDLIQVLTLVSGVLLPLIVGLVTTKVTNAGRKAIFLAALSVIIPIVAQLIDALRSGTAYDLGAALFTALGTFVIAVATHYGFWKPTGTAQAVQAVGDKSSTNSVPSLSSK